MKTFWLSLVTVVMAIDPAVADAGPITVGWQVSGSVDSLPGGKSPGSLDIPTASGIVTISNRGGGGGGATISLNGWAASVTGAYHSGPLVADFHVVVTLTDEASGQSRSITEYGLAAATKANSEAFGSGQLLGEISGWTNTPTTFMLGTNQYSVWINPAVGGTPYSPKSPNGGPTTPLVADIEVSVTRDSPEPSTLALITVGISLVGLFGRRRA